MAADVPSQMLTSLPLDTEAWVRIARQAPWHMTRMNLNTFARHGVFVLNYGVDMTIANLRQNGRIANATTCPWPSGMSTTCAAR